MSKLALQFSFEDAVIYYNHVIMEAAAAPPAAKIELYRQHARNDLFFLLVYVLNRKDCLHPWLYERCREVQASPDGHLDLWAREHYKSTVITFALTIQDILKDPEARIAIFSHTRPQAKGFLRQIKNEFENNPDLRLYFSDVLWENVNNAPKWSEDDGIIVKRKGNPKEATLEAWGLVDGMPTGKHFTHRIYDDVVTDKTVTSPEMVKKADDALALSVDLGTDDGVERYIGTRYSNFDSYNGLLEKGVLTPRIHPACPYTILDKNKLQIHFERAVLKDPEYLTAKYQKQGAYIFGCQQLQLPQADVTKQFTVGNLDYWDIQPGRGMNRCIIVDPASGRKSQESSKKDKQRKLDNTVMWVLYRGADDHWYLVDGVVDNRLDLGGRAKALMELHVEHKPQFVFYEEYGMQADIQYIKIRQKQLNYHFEVTPLGGQMKKENRIMRLQPLIDGKRLHLPRSLIKLNSDGEAQNLVKRLIEEEMTPYPIVQHDDMLDCLSRICDEDVDRMVPAPKVPDSMTRQDRLIKSIRREQRRSRPVV